MEILKVMKHMSMPVVHLGASLSLDIVSLMRQCVFICGTFLARSKCPHYTTEYIQIVPLIASAPKYTGVFQLPRKLDTFYIYLTSTAV